MMWWASASVGFNPRLRDYSRCPASRGRNVSLTGRCKALAMRQKMSPRQDGLEGGELLELSALPDPDLHWPAHPRF